MADEQQHPITTPKGASALTVILAVIGVFTPFFTSLETAQLFTAVAILVIVWLYWTELVDVAYGRRKPFELILPTSSLAIIIGVAVVASLKASAQVVQQTAPPPALTAQDVTNLLEKTLARTSPQAPPPVVRSEVQRPTYRVVIADERPSRPVLVRPESKSVPVDDAMFRSIRQQTAGSKEWSQCLSASVKLSTGLFGLTVEATRYQNAYHDGHNDEQVIKNLQTWITKAEEFFAQYKDELPDVSVVRLANSEGRASTFLGIHNSGVRAWAALDSKRRALEAIQRDTGRQSCEAARNAAIAACVKDGKC